jgi:hypothetical protein
MDANRESLEDQLERHESQLKSLKSYRKELNDMTAKHGTERAEFESDLFEVEHNVKYYEGEVARIKSELKEIGEYAPDKGGARPPYGAPDTVLPRTMKQGVGSLLFSAISFAAGMLLGSKLNSRPQSRNAPGRNERYD